jgi:hypothetical protein
LEGAEDHPFLPRAKGFSRRNAWWLAELSFLAYEHPGFIRLVYKTLGMEMRAFIQGSTAGFVAYDNEKVFVVYRGTQVRTSGAISDILIDIRFPPEPVSGRGEAHGGFYGAFSSVWDGPEGIRAFIGDLLRERPRRSLWFTGHSLGAAIATLSYAHYPEARGLYTFGTPKVGDRAFCQSLGKEFYNVICLGDVITRLPPRIPALKDFPGNVFVHGGEIWVLEPEGRLERRDCDDGEFAEIWVKTLRGFKNSLRELFFRKSGEGQPSAGLRQLFTSYIVGEIALHAPVYYALGTWNAYCGEKDANALQ